MKDLDPKSLLIGVLATALLFACADADKTSPSIVSEAKAATGVNDKWDANQQWEVKTHTILKRLGDVEYLNGTEHHQRVVKGGWEPFAHDNPYGFVYRRRIK